MSFRQYSQNTHHITPTFAPKRSHVEINRVDDIPPIGQHRCYWCILTAGLNFLFIDPVLSAHLEDQASAVIGRSILDFIHPEERDVAQLDLGNQVEQRGLYGSVTRVRFNRLSTARTNLGFSGPQGQAGLASTYEARFPEARKIVIDQNYMACDIVLNWAADHPKEGGILLCFIHAAIDIDSVMDSIPDDLRKTGWSNWCGARFLRQEHIEALSRRLFADLPQSPFSHISMPPNRLFQILANSTEREVIFAWPPATSASDFARLAHGVDFDSNYNARTGCQRRFQSQEIVRDGVQVESIFIPYGVIIFACHRIETSPLPSSSAPVAHLHNEPNSQDYNFQNQQLSQSSGQHFPDSSYEHHSYTESAYTGSYPSSGIRGGVPTPSPPPLPETMNTNYTQSNPWNTTGLNRAYQSQGQQAEYSPYPQSQSTEITYDPHSVPLPVTTPNTPEEVGNQCAQCGTTESPEWRNGPSGKKDLCNACGLRFSRSLAKLEGYKPAKRRKKEPEAAPSGASSLEILSAVAGEDAASINAQRQNLPHSLDTQFSPESPASGSASNSKLPPWHAFSPRGREGGGPKVMKPFPSSQAKAQTAPPTGIQCCVQCKTTASPEWRKGPSGAKELCNACGLRFARSTPKEPAIKGRGDKAASLLKASAASARYPSPPDTPQQIQASLSTVLEPKSHIHPPAP